MDNIRQLMVKKVGYIQVTGALTNKNRDLTNQKGVLIKTYSD